MKILCVIPSRIGSTRLLRKPLLPIKGKPMVQMVYESASKCPVLDKVVVATDSEEIRDVIKNCGGNVEMTAPNLRTGSDRVAAVAEKYKEMDVVINLQGDEPFIKPKMIEQLVAPYLSGDDPDMTTLAYKLDVEKDYEDPGAVKVITNLNMDAIYFSRSPIPGVPSVIPANVGIQSIINKAPVYHQMGVYAFKRDFLLKYRDLPQTPLELTESLEQLRAIEHGYRIKVCLTEEKTLEINTADDLAKVEHFQYNV